jgi:hypothetical protein
MHKLLGSGSVLYGDTFSQISSRIADLLLASDPKLRAKLRFYTLRNSTPNAFSTHDGVIVVTEGLYARLNSEAELAFVLAHEIGHYLYQHVLDGFVRKKTELKGDGYAGAGTFFSKRSKLRYSRTAELEADYYAFGLFTKANYSWAAIFSSFDVLSKTRLPLGEDSTLFRDLETPTFKLRNDIALVKFKTIRNTERQDDSYLTHPNIFRRRNQIIRLKNSEKYDDRKEGSFGFYYSNEDWQKISKIAKIDVLYLLALEGDYVSFLYNARFLESQYENIGHLKKMTAYAWYSMQTAANNGTEWRYKRYNREGEISRLANLLNKCSKREINGLALREIWKRSEAIEDTNYRSVITTQSFKQFRNKLFTDGKSFVRDTTELNGFNPNWSRVWLIDLFDISGFETCFTADYTIVKKPNEPHVSVDSITMIQTSFIRYDLRKTRYKSLVQSSEKEEVLKAKLEKVGKIRGITISQIPNGSSPLLTTEVFNDFVVFNDWFELSSNIGSNLNRLIPPNYLYMKQRLKKYGGGLIGICGVHHITEKKYFNGWALLSLALMGAWTIPLYLVWQFSPMQRTLYEMYVIDTETGMLYVYDHMDIPSKYRNDLISARLYHSLNIIKSKNDK